MLCVPATPHSLSLVRCHVAEAAMRAGLDRCAAYRLRLAVDEIVTNIVTHGYGTEAAEATISVWAWTDVHALHVVVEDTSPAYAPRFEAPRVLDETCVDALRYERRHGRNWHMFDVARRPVHLHSTLDYPSVELPQPALHTY